jgi:putative pyruvate formate lyase activating enzyme
MPLQKPSYIETHEKGLLRKKRETAFQFLESCTLCPRECQVDRLSGETGICKTGARARVSSYSPHFGEEQPLVGQNGSGTIFFTHCNLLCNFCQNYDISHQGMGETVSDRELAAMMLELQRMGCHNINFVTPTHVVPQILSALETAVEAGLTVPLVYNSGGYDRVAALRLLEGIVDIYMPDFKFWEPDIAKRTCDAEDYPETARNALVEMHRQVGDLRMNDQGIAYRGLLVRHLVLPHGLAGTREIMRFIATRISKETYVNIMPQYRPCGRADEIPELSKALSTRDFQSALDTAQAEGVHRLDSRRRVFVLW